jgi:hypothetical protein
MMARATFYLTHCTFGGTAYSPKTYGPFRICAARGCAARGLSFLEMAMYAHFTELNGPHRAALIFTHGGDAVMHFAVLTELPATDDYQLARDLARIWDNYSIGQTIPVVIFQESEMIGYSVMPLPSGAGTVSFCGRCGNCDHTEPRCPL